MKSLQRTLLNLALFWASVTIAAPTTRHAPMYPIITGSEQVNAPVALPPYPETSPLDETDLIGDTTTLGMTWYESQHNGTCGRMNTLEPDGWRQFCWMKGENEGASSRHIWWNAIDPEGHWVFPGTGVQIESTTRGGFCNMDVDSSGRANIIYHATLPGGGSGIFISQDFFPHFGAFLDFQLPPAPYPLYWPRIQINQNQKIQVVACSQGNFAGSPQRLYCITLPDNTTWTLMDWTQTIAHDVGVSPVPGSNKTLWAWTRSREYIEPDPTLTYNQLNNDIYYLIDADGLNPNFNAKINLTNFIPPDSTLLPDTLHANKDTLRANTDLNCFIDHNNYAHIVFTTRSYFKYGSPSGPTSYWNASLIWHWSEQWPETFRVVGDESYFASNNNVDCGAWNLKAQRPSLGEDAAGNLYCMYQVYDTDTTHLTDPPDFLPSGEIYITVSTDGGLHWSQGVNVTTTITPNQAVLGQSWSEITPTIAKKVNDYCHIEYVLDKDAGNVMQTEGGWTNNPVRYHCVPTASIPTTPLLVQTKQLHITPEPPPPPTSLDVTLTPINPPIYLPANGGGFQFTASARRAWGTQVPFWVWARIKNPDGTYTAPTLGPVQINPPVNVIVSRLRTQTVPSTWPPGIYAYKGYAHPTFSYPATDSSSFLFAKTATDDGNPRITDASCTGESFSGEVGGDIVSGSGATPTMRISPNPFNATTAISYELQAASYVSLKVYDPAGRLVASLVEEWREAGSHKAIFDGSELPSGVYLYRLEMSGSRATPTTMTGKLMLVK